MLMAHQSHSSTVQFILTEAADSLAELQNRLALAIKTCSQLKLFWTKANTSAQWKFRVFNTIVRSKLMYSLENVQLTQAEMNKLDAFQVKSFRRILGVPPAFIDRTQSCPRKSGTIRS